MIQKQPNQTPLTNVDYEAIADATLLKQPAPKRLADGDDRATEVANAEELYKRDGADIRYDADRGQFLKWDGTRWAYDIDGHAWRCAMRVAKSTGNRLIETVTPNELKRFIARAESAAGIHGVLKIFQKMPGITVHADRLDTDGYALNCSNGTVDLRNGTLRPHCREDLNTIVLTVPFDAKATAPKWDAFLLQIMGGNTERIAFLQRIAGAALVGAATDHTLPIFYGEGANGKSVFIDTLLGMLGAYACVAPDSLLTASGRGQQHPTEIADLRGKRLVVASETEAGASLRIGLVKKLTGDLVLKGRFMHRNFFEFRRTHTLVMVTNNRPRLPENGEAVWRRLRIVSFDVTIPPEQRDPDLIEKLKAEWPGILAWAGRGCLDWQQNGMQPPSDVMQATDEYRADADELADFIAAECIEGDAKTFRCSRKDLYAAYTRWAKASNEREPMTRTVFYESIRKRNGIGADRWKAGRKPVRGFKGISVCHQSAGGDR